MHLLRRTVDDMLVTKAAHEGELRAVVVKDPLGGMCGKVELSSGGKGTGGATSSTSECMSEWTLQITVETWAVADAMTAGLGKVVLCVGRVEPVVRGVPEL